jgi:hypothetical protein
MSDRLFSDMNPLQKLEHCRRCIAEGYKHLQAEHGPVELADILDVWDFWVPYLLARVERLEAVAETSRKIRNKYPGGKLLWFSEFDEFEKALKALDSEIVDLNAEAALRLAL